MSHAPTAPSDAPAWGPPGGCRASVALKARFPEPKSIPAEEGTAAHEAAEMLVKGTRPSNILGKTAANGVTITQEMIDAACVYADDIRAVLLASPHNLGAHTEQRLPMPQIHASEYGTLDCFIFDPVTSTFYLWDFKYGRRDVQAFENYQMICYAAGVIEKLGLFPAVRIVMRIVQPRTYGPPIKEWRTTGKALEPFIAQLRVAAHEALGPDPIARSGPHCKDCRPLKCAVARQAGLDWYETAAVASVEDLCVEDLCVLLGHVRRAKEQLEFLDIAYTEQLSHAARAGTVTPGWDLKPGKGRTDWSVPASVAILTADSLGCDIRKPDAILTPIQAEAAGMDPAVVAGLSTKTPGAMKLKAAKNEAKRIFS